MLKKYLVISTATDLVRITPDKIVYVSSDGNYCNLVQVDNETRLLTFQLGQIETMIRDQLGTDGNLFIRIGRGLIINRNYIYYINIQSRIRVYWKTCKVAFRRIMTLEEGTILA